MGVRLVREDPVHSVARQPAVVPANGDLRQQWEQLGVVPGLAFGEEHGHRQTAAVDREVDLAAQPAAGPPDRLPLDGDRVDAGPTAPFLRAPAACWCARTTVESTATVHSTTPTESSFTTTSARIASQVPSAAHFRSRSCGLPRPVPFGNITPRRTRAQLPQDRVQHLPVIPPTTAPTTGRRQQRLDPRPSPIGEFTSSNHTSIISNNTSKIRRTRPRRYRTVQIRAGNQILTAADPLPRDLRDALALIN